MSISTSPSAHLRQSIQKAYRLRGKRNQNLWLVYSAKTDRDWLLSNDRKLIHWLYFLEADPNVEDFDLAPLPVRITDDDELIELDAVAVCRDGWKEWHVIQSGGLHEVEGKVRNFQEIAFPVQERIRWRVFSENELRACSVVALRWFKAISFAAAIREYQNIACQNQLLAHLRLNSLGRVGSTISELAEQDVSVVLGILVRFAIQGVIRLDLTERSFGLQTEWRLNDGQTS